MQYCKSKTRILVTHALYYLKYVDKVLIVEDGQIVEQGNYETIRNSNRFKNMYNSMMKDEKSKRQTTTKIIPIEEGEIDINELEDDLIEEEIIREASIHTKKSRTASAIDRAKLENLRSIRSRKSKVSQLKNIDVKEETGGKSKAKKKEEVVMEVKKAAPAPNAN